MREMLGPIAPGDTPACQGIICPAVEVQTDELVSAQIAALEFLDTELCGVLGEKENKHLCQKLASHRVATPMRTLGVLSMGRHEIIVHSAGLGYGASL